MVGTFFKDDDFEYMMLGALGATYHKCADIGECLTAAASIFAADAAAGRPLERKRAR
jgi:hypothetical protein